MSLLVQLAVVVIVGLLISFWLTQLPSARRARARGGRRRGRVANRADLDPITGVVTVGRGSAGDVHRTLRPLLREIASARLARVGIALDREPDRARALLGEDLWELVRPGRPVPERRGDPGLSMEALKLYTDRLEAL